MLIDIKSTEISNGLRRKCVMVSDYPDGRFGIITYNGVILPYRIFDKIQHVSQASIVENKFLGGVLEFIRKKQDREDRPNRSTRASARQGLPPTIFRVG